MKKIEVPYYKQSTVYTCGPASLQMVLAYYGYQDSEENLLKLLNTSSQDGTWRVRMYETAVNLGFHCYVNNEASLSEIDFFLDLGIPLIIRFIETDNDEDHYGVIVGSTHSSLKIHDPWSGPEIELSKKDFENRWICYEIGNCKRWLMAVSPEPIPLGRQFHPVKSE